MKHAVAAHFDVQGMTAQQYDAAIRELERAGLGNPAERRVHVAAQTPTGWSVVDVWESAEALNDFAKVLMPILIKQGVTPPQPSVRPLHNLLCRTE